MQLTQNQFDALVSLTFNIGEGGFGKSNLLKYINSGICDAATIEKGFMGWTRAGGSPHALDNRRAAEIHVFNNGVYHLLSGGNLEGSNEASDTGFGGGASETLSEEEQERQEEIEADVDEWDLDPDDPWCASLRS